jgi:hypothetical protein
VTGTTSAIDQVIQTQRRDPSLSDQDRADLDQLQRLPFISAHDALALLGPVAHKLKVPQQVKDRQAANKARGPSSSLFAVSVVAVPGASHAIHRAQLDQATRQASSKSVPSRAPAAPVEQMRTPRTLSNTMNAREPTGSP